MAAVELELSLKRRIIDIHKDLTGIGPKSVYVQVIKNMLIVKFCGCFTVLEKQLVLEKGGDYVSDLRNSLLSAFMRGFDAKAKFGTPLLDYHVSFAPHKDSIHLFFVFEQNIDQVND